MKKLKRAACILLALVMTLSMTVTAFADEADSDASATGSITITNATIGESYHVYKLFDTTYGESYTDENGDTVIPTAYTATPAQEAALEAVEGNVFAFTLLSDGTYQVTIGTDENGDTYSDEAVIAFVKSYVIELSEDVTVCYFPGATEVTGSENVGIEDNVATASTVVFNNLPLGYYFVTSSLGSVISLSTTNPAATITDKNTTEPSWDNDSEEPVPDDPVKAVLKKTVDEEEGTTTYRDINKEKVSVGDILTYQISYTNDLEVALDEVVVTDEAPEGTEFVEGSMKIFTLAEDGTLTAYDGTTEVADGTLTWTVTNLPAGATLVVEFQVTVTKEALTIEDRTVVNDADLVVTLGENKYNLKTNVVENPVGEKDEPVKDVVEVNEEGTYESIDGDKVEVGQVLTYTITYTVPEDETGTVTLTIEDAPPAGTVYVKDSATTTLEDQTDIDVDEDNNITWKVKNLEANDTVTVSFQVTVTEAALSLTESTITNSADWTIGDNTYKTNTVKNPTDEEEPDEPEPEDFGKVIIEDDGTETTVSTGAFGDTVTFDVSIDAVNSVTNDYGRDANEDGILDPVQVSAYYIYDRMDPGFDLVESSFELTINDVKYTVEKDEPSTSEKSTTYTITGKDGVTSTLFTYVDDEGYTIIAATIPWVDGEGNGLYPDCEIHLTYKATINENAKIAGNGNVNRAIYDYSTVDVEKPIEPNPEDPKYPTDPKTDLNHETDERTTVTYTYALGIQKISAETGDALAGAEFSAVDVTGHAIYAVPVYDTDGETILHYNYSAATAAGATSTFTSNASGQILIKGVDVGTYTFTEGKAPNGYVLLTDDVEITAQMDSSSTSTTYNTATITRYFEELTADDWDTYSGDVYTKDNDGSFTLATKPDAYTEGYYKLTKTSTEESEESVENTVTYTFAASVASIIVANAAGSTLPGTGGMGTTLFYLVGGILVLGAAVLLITRRRMSRN